MSGGRPDDAYREPRAARAAAEARPAGRPPSVDTEDAWPGQSWGLPEHGPGSVATAPRRLGQFLLDLLIGGAVASAFAFPAPPTLSLIVWAVLVTVPVALIGQTPAMVVTGLRVARVDGAERVGVWSLARTISLFFVVPAVIMDRHGRGLHDRVSRTVVLRSR